MLEMINAELEQIEGIQNKVDAGVISIEDIQNRLNEESLIWLIYLSMIQRPTTTTYYNHYLTTTTTTTFHHYHKETHYPKRRPYGLDDLLVYLYLRTFVSKTLNHVL